LGLSTLQTIISQLQSFSCTQASTPLWNNRQLLTTNKQWLFFPNNSFSMPQNPELERVRMNEEHATMIEELSE
jgi:hypothetical protein